MTTTGVAWMTPTKVSERAAGNRHFSTSFAALSLPRLFSPALCRVPSTSELYVGQSLASPTGSFLAPAAPLGQRGEERNRNQGYPGEGDPGIAAPDCVT